MITAAEVLATYHRLNGNIKKTAKAVGLSHQTVRRILITHGIFVSDRTQTIHRMLFSGYTKEEICKTLNISKKALQAHMAYTKGSYAVGSKSRTAERIAQWRAKKITKESDQP